MTSIPILSTPPFSYGLGRKLGLSVRGNQLRAFLAGYGRHVRRLAMHVGTEVGPVADDSRFCFTKSLRMREQTVDIHFGVVALDVVLRDREGPDKRFGD